MCVCVCVCVCKPTGATSVNTFWLTEWLAVRLRYCLHANMLFVCISFFVCLSFGVPKRNGNGNGDDDGDDVHCCFSIKYYVLNTLDGISKRTGAHLHSARGGPQVGGTSFLDVSHLLCRCSL